MVKKPSGKKAPEKKAGAKKARAKKGVSTTVRKASGASDSDVARRIVETALALAVERGWRDLSLAEIAEAAGLPLSQVYAIFSSKQAILGGFADRVDAAMLAEGGEDTNLPARDRLFDMVMRRFDALQPHREALGIIAQDQLCDPLTLCCGLHRFRRSMAATLEGAGFSTSGCRGVLRIKGLSAICLSTFRVWLRDDSEDMARTMAHLDRQLSRVDALIARLQRYRPGRSAA